MELKQRKKVTVREGVKRLTRNGRALLVFGDCIFASHDGQQWFVRMRNGAGEYMLTPAGNVVTVAHRLLVAAGEQSPWKESIKMTEDETGPALARLHEGLRKMKTPATVQPYMVREFLPPGCGHSRAMCMLRELFKRGAFEGEPKRVKTGGSDLIKWHIRSVK